jgi:glycosyltransferase involved in cell wall biosynthesis
LDPADPRGTDLAPPGRTADAPLLSVLVPVYNEVGRVRTLLDRVRAVPISKEIVVVDDGSTDGTREVLREYAAGGDDVAAHARLPRAQPGQGGGGPHGDRARDGAIT